ncbi:MAG: hypothetical protein PHI12_08060 [Dehalococcoidales bacterium]|jgi:hypothetical protein|nr:hypothetical protein [Sphaerochaeta sp.]MDD5510748.1 hypothetical protein [Dehalococcoidales bacterium]
MVGELAKQLKGEMGKRIVNMQWKPGSMLTAAIQQTMSQFMFQGLSKAMTNVGKRFKRE